MVERARFVVQTAPERYEIRETGLPDIGADDALLAIEACGVCGTDVEFFAGDMAYLRTGEAAYPMRIGHEWSGTVSAVGSPFASRAATRILANFGKYLLRGSSIRILPCS